MSSITGVLRSFVKDAEESTDVLHIIPEPISAATKVAIPIMIIRFAVKKKTVLQHISRYIILLPPTKMKKHAYIER